MFVSGLQGGSRKCDEMGRQLRGRRALRRRLHARRVVLQALCSDESPGVRQQQEPIQVHVLAPVAGAKAHCERVLRGLVRPDEVEAHVLLLGPRVQRASVKRLATVHDEAGRILALPSARLQDGDDALVGRRSSTSIAGDSRGQVSATVRARKAEPHGQRMAHEVHRPSLVRRPRSGQRHTIPHQLLAPPPKHGEVVRPRDVPNPLVIVPPVFLLPLLRSEKWTAPAGMLCRQRLRAPAYSAVVPQPRAIAPEFKSKLKHRRARRRLPAAWTISSTMLRRCYVDSSICQDVLQHLNVQRLVPDHAWQPRLSSSSVQNRLAASPF